MLDLALTTLQWVATAVTLTAAWLVASQSRSKRRAGFWCFILSNGLWVLWAWYDGAYALIGLQAGLFFLNLRGAGKNQSVSQNSDISQREVS